MNSWSSLPSEALQRIFQLLLKPWYERQPVLLQCMLVCKEWKILSQIVYYSKIDFRPQAKLDRFMDTIEKNPLLGTYVKIFSYFSKLKKDELKRLAVLLPNLEYFDTNPDFAFYTGLIQLNDSTRWNYLKSIPYPQKTKDIDLYIMCALEYRLSLKSIVLSDKLLCEPGEGEKNDEEIEGIDEDEDLTDTDDNDENIHSEEDYYDDEPEYGDEDYDYTNEYNGWYGKKNPVQKKLPSTYEDKFKVLGESLNLYPCLESLYINDRHSDKGIEFYDTIINKCRKSLRSIEFVIRPANVSKISTIPDGPLDIRNIKPRRNIQELIVEGSLLLSDNSLLYIMHKFPALKRIKLNHSERLFRYEEKVSSKILAAKENFSPQVIAAFMRFIEKIPVHHFGLFFTRADIPLVMKHYIKTRGGLMKPLTISSGEVEHMAVADIEVSNCSRLRSCPSSGDISIVFQNTRKRFVLPELIKSVGLFLTKLYFITDKICWDPNSKKNSTYDLSKVLSGSFLELFFLHCSNLKELWIENAKISHCEPEMFTNRSITHMTMISVELNQKILPEISDCLPSLKFLKFQFCNFDHHDTKKTHQFLFDMPETCLDTLEIFGGMDGMPNPTFKYTCLFIKVLTEKQQQYFGVYPEGHVTKPTVEAINEAEYLACSRLPRCALYSFRFKSLKNLKIGDWSGAKRLHCEIDLTDLSLIK